jgi:putative membrane protein
MEEEPVTPVMAAREQLQLAVERTYLAHERNLMAWTRTATSLITFGFTLFKFFEYLHQNGQGEQPAQAFGARTFGLIMMGIGATLLTLATIQHWWEMRRLRAADHAYSHFPFALILAGLITALGILGFATAFWNWR